MWARRPRSGGRGGHVPFTRLFDAVFAVVASLLGVAVVIALLGLANTMALSSLERMREFALLRSLGLTGRQMYGVLVVEALFVAGIGISVGALLGASFGTAAASSVMPDMVTSLPWARIALLLTTALPIALLAAAAPGRTAAGISVSELTSGSSGTV